MQLSIKEQFILFSSVMKLFESYPKNLQKYIQGNNLSHWQMVRDMEYVSFWYENLVNKITPRMIYRSRHITSKEIENAKKYLLLKKLNVNKSNMSKLTGCNFHGSYNKLEEEL
jgi:hypothetical protein